MPHRPLFVLRCHHFSPVIYFIAISVSLPPSPPSLQCLSSFFTCALSHPPPSSSPLVPSFSCTLSIHPAAHRAYEHLARNSPLHNATQFSPHPPGDFIIRFCFRLVLTPSHSQSSSSCRASFSLSLALPRTGGISTTMLSARKKGREEDEAERGRNTR